MISILKRKTKLQFVTPLTSRHRPVVVRVEPWGLVLREKGCRNELSISWAQIYNRACQNAAELRRKRKGGAM